MTLSDWQNASGYSGVTLLILALLCKFLWHWGDWVFIIPSLILAVWAATLLIGACS